VPASQRDKSGQIAGNRGGRFRQHLPGSPRLGWRIESQPVSKPTADTHAPTVTVVLMGVSGSGKSTVMARLVERFAWRSAEADDLHPAENVAKMAAGQPLTDADRWPWLRTLAAWIGEREESRENGVITCSALRRAYRDFLRDGHPSVRFVHLTVDREVLERRMGRRRGHYMPPSLLSSQLATLEALQSDEPGVVLSGELPPDRIVDAIAARFVGAGDVRDRSAS
jgi:gluconokinase